MDREIVVRGEGHRRVLPDRAGLHVTARGEAGERQDAYAAAAAEARYVDEVLDRFAAALGRVTRASLVVQPRTRWAEGEAVRTGWVASRSTAVEVVDLDRLGELFAELAAVADEVTGPDWELDPDNAAHAEARRAAAADARARAQEYADALGLRLGAVASVTEPAVRAPGGPRPVRLMAAAVRAAGGPREVVELAPPELTVTAEVDVAFRVEG